MEAHQATKEKSNTKVFCKFDIDNFLCYMLCVDKIKKQVYNLMCIYIERRLHDFTEVLFHPKTNHGYLIN